jgi:hypothetical protein
MSQSDEVHVVVYVYLSLCTGQVTAYTHSSLQRPVDYGRFEEKYLCLFSESYETNKNMPNKCRVLFFLK